MVLHVHLAQQLMKNAKFDEKSHAHGDATQRMRKKNRQIQNVTPKNKETCFKNKENKHKNNNAKKAKKHVNKNRKA